MFLGLRDAKATAVSGRRCFFGEANLFSVLAFGVVGSAVAFFGELRLDLGVAGSRIFFGDGGAFSNLALAGEGLSFTSCILMVVIGFEKTAIYGVFVWTESNGESPYKPRFFNFIFGIIYC